MLDQTRTLKWHYEYIDLGTRKDGPVWRERAWRYGRREHLRFDFEVGPGFWPIYVDRVSRLDQHRFQTVLAEQAFDSEQAAKDWCEAYEAGRVAA